MIRACYPGSVVLADITVTILESIRADIAGLKDHFESRFDRLDDRIDRTNEQLDVLDQRLSTRIDRTNEQLESIVNLMGLLARSHGSLEARVTALEEGS
jgi:hypothetical protein